MLLSKHFYCLNNHNFHHLYLLLFSDLASVTVLCLTLKNIQEFLYNSTSSNVQSIQLCRDLGDGMWWLAVST